MVIALAGHALSQHAATGPEVKLLNGKAYAELHFQDPNNLVVVEASVNGSAPALFIFDTGAESTVVDAAFARRIKLTSSGKTIGTGSAGTATAGVVKNARMQIGDVEASKLTVYTLPLGFLATGLGVRVAGIIGNDVIGKLIAEIDYATRRVLLYPPDSYAPLKGSETLPLEVRDGLPFVRVPLDPGSGETLSARMEIDTGSTGAVLFNSPFVRNQNLVALVGQNMASRTGGVGGSGASLVARIKSLALGRSTVTEPLATLYTGTKGDNASSKYDGLLGGAIFRRFRIVVDMPGRNFSILPNLHFDEPFETDMSGLDLVADGPDLGRILVDEVKAGSVAAKAGVLGGETIRSIDGRPASEIGLQEVRRILRNQGEVDVELARGRRVFTVHLILKRVI
jgi:hypothetical protein